MLINKKILTKYIQKKFLFYLNYILPKIYINANICLENIYSKILFFDLFFFLNFLKKHNFCQFKQLIDIICQDFLQKSIRFQIIYYLATIPFNNRIFITTNTNEYEYIYSIITIYKNADWIERELWDLFGILFKNHDDLRRILSDYGFSWFPLRKDFPLTGHVEIYFNDIQKLIAFTQIELTQDLREFLIYKKI